MSRPPLLRRPWQIVMLHVLVSGRGRPGDTTRQPIRIRAVLQSRSGQCGAELGREHRTGIRTGRWCSSGRLRREVPRPVTTAPKTLEAQLESGRRTRASHRRASPATTPLSCKGNFAFSPSPSLPAGFTSASFTAALWARISSGRAAFPPPTSQAMALAYPRADLPLCSMQPVVAADHRPLPDLAAWRARYRQRSPPATLPARWPPSPAAQQ